MDAGLLQLSGKTYFRRCERQTHLLFVFLLIRENRMSFYEENKALSLELQTTACILYVWELDSTKGDI